MAGTRAIGGADVAGLDQQLVGGNDRVISVDVGQIVVAGRQTAGHQHAAIDARRVYVAVAARDRQRAAECGRSFAIDEARVTHAAVARRIALRDEFSIAIGRHGQCRLGDGAAATGPLQIVVARLRSCQGYRAPLYRYTAAGIGAGIGRAARQRYRIGPDHARQAAQGVAGGHGRAAVVGLVDAGAAAVGEGLRRNCAAAAIPDAGAQRVVAAIGAAHSEVGEINAQGLAGTRILVAETGGAAHAHAIAAQYAGQAKSRR